MKTIAAALTLVVVLSVSTMASAQPSNVYMWGIVSTKCCAQYDAPTPVNGIPNAVVQVVASNSDVYALDSTGAVWAWGQGSRGELGNGTLPEYTNRPARVELPTGVVITSLPDPMPYDTGLAIDSHGNVWGWGLGGKALCSSARDLTTPMELRVTDVTLASGAGDHTLFDSNGTVYACGVNGYGDLGDGTTTPSAAPVAVVGLPDEPVKSLVSAWRDSGALMADGSFYSWGFNAAGQLGDGTKVESDVPVRVLTEASVTEVYQGGSLSDNGQTIAILSDGSVWTWGNNVYGQLGDGTDTDSTVPVRVDVPSGVTFTQVATSGASSYAIASSGLVYSWGANDYGQLGNGRASTTGVETPQAIAVFLTQISATAGNVVGEGRRF